MGGGPWSGRRVDVAEPDAAAGAGTPDFRHHGTCSGGAGSAGHEHVSDWYRASFRFRPARRIQTIEAPTLLIWGEDDPFLGKALTYRLEEWVPKLAVHYIQRCSHWVQNEAAEEVNEQLTVFL